MAKDHIISQSMADTQPPTHKVLVLCNKIYYQSMQLYSNKDVWLLNNTILNSIGGNQIIDIYSLYSQLPILREVKTTQDIKPK